ncbi:hypothetical protein IG631_03196 [Alternaria alternata]|jgi:hypothetical protein|nr:hypothetical protein IG631_03196 [Alternaria alternata]
MSWEWMRLMLGTKGGDAAAGRLILPTGGAGADQSWLSAAVDRRRSLTPASLPEKLHGARSSVEESCFYGKTGCARYR